jgi:MFS family permease
MMYSGLLALLVITCSDFADIMALRYDSIPLLTQEVPPKHKQILLRLPSRHNTALRHHKHHVVNLPSNPIPFLPTHPSPRWKTSEQPLRIGIWASGASFGSIVGQGIDFGAIKIGGEYADHRWKWIYVIIGSISMGFALVMFLFMPDSPMKALFLTEREKAIAVQRLQGNNTGIQTRKFKWRQFVEAFLDPQLYAFCVIGFSFAFANAALGRWDLDVLDSGDLADTQSQLWGPTGYLLRILKPRCPQAVHASFRNRHIQHAVLRVRSSLPILPPTPLNHTNISICTRALSFKFHRHRCLMACLFILPTIAGNALLWKSPRDNKSALLAGLYIVSFPSSSFPSLTSRTISFLYPSSFHQPFTPTLTSNPKSQQPSTAPTSSSSPSFPPT